MTEKKSKGKKVFLTVLILLGIAAGIKFIPGLISSPPAHSCGVHDTIKAPVKPVITPTPPPTHLTH